MPLETVPVDEDGARRRDVLVVVDQERQVRHGLVGAVGRHLQHLLRRLQQGRRVHVVDADVVLVAEGIEPRGFAIGFDAGDDERGLGGGGEAGAEAVRRRDGRRFSGVRRVADAGPGE